MTTGTTACGTCAAPSGRNDKKVPSYFESHTCSPRGAAIADVAPPPHPPQPLPQTRSNNTGGTRLRQLLLMICMHGFVVRPKKRRVNAPPQHAQATMGGRSIHMMRLWYMGRRRMFENVSRSNNYKIYRQRCLHSIGQHQQLGNVRWRCDHLLYSRITTTPRFVHMRHRSE